MNTKHTPGPWKSPVEEALERIHRDNKGSAYGEAWDQVRRAIAAAKGEA